MCLKSHVYGVCSINCGCNGDNDGIDGFRSERPVELGYPERRGMAFQVS